MNSSFPNRWSFSYLKFTKYVTNIIAEPKYKYGQQEQVTVRNHNKSTALEQSVLKYWNIKSEMRSFKSNENIHKKEGGSYYVVSANKASSVTL